MYSTDMDGTVLENSTVQPGELPLLKFMCFRTRIFESITLLTPSPIVPDDNTAFTHSPQPLK